jgi:hypothetical protein
MTIEKLKDNLWGLSDKYVPGSEGIADKYLASPAGEDLVKRLSFCLYQKRLRNKVDCDPYFDWKLAEAIAKRGLIRQISRIDSRILTKSWQI